MSLICSKMKRIIYLIFLIVGFCVVLYAQPSNIYPPTHIHWQPINYNVALLHKSNGILNIYQMDSVGNYMHKERKLKGDLCHQQEGNYYIVYKCSDRLWKMDSIEFAEIKNVLQNRKQWENTYRTLTPDTTFIAVYLNGILRYYTSNYDTIHPDVKALFSRMYVPFNF